MWPSHFVTSTNQGGHGDRKEEGMQVGYLVFIILH